MHAGSRHYGLRWTEMGMPMDCLVEFEWLHFANYILPPRPLLSLSLSLSEIKFEGYDSWFYTNWLGHYYI